jgi:hypothetical protein
VYLYLVVFAKLIQPLCSKSERLNVGGRAFRLGLSVLSISNKYRYMTSSGLLPASKFCFR